MNFAMEIWSQETEKTGRSMAQSYKGELGFPGCGGHMKAIERAFEKVLFI